MLRLPSSFARGGREQRRKWRAGCSSLSVDTAWLSVRLALQVSLFFPLPSPVETGSGGREGLSEDGSEPSECVTVLLGSEPQSSRLMTLLSHCVDQYLLLLMGPAGYSGFAWLHTEIGGSRAGYGRILAYQRLVLLLDIQFLKSKRSFFFSCRGFTCHV